MIPVKHEFDSDIVRKLIGEKEKLREQRDELLKACDEACEIMMEYQIPLKYVTKLETLILKVTNEDNCS
jgi:hypothetical protein